MDMTYSFALLQIRRFVCFSIYANFLTLVHLRLLKTQIKQYEEKFVNLAATINNISFSY